MTGALSGFSNFYKDFFINLYFLCRSVFPAFVFRGQKRAPGALEPELWMVVTHCAVLGTEPQVLGKSILYSFSIEPSLQPLLISLELRYLNNGWLGF